MDFLTLSQLNSLVGKEVKKALPDTYWVLAETSDVRPNKNGHCYLELLEKNGTSIIAKARGYIWNSTFQLLNPYFEKVTGQAFVSGIKILVRVSVEFHPLYGYGLNIVDIDPTYTLGDMQQQRKEILAQLEKDGVLNLNKELELALIPQRIAVISSATAAGYEDFINHLSKNKYGFVFYPVLFPAIMQGEQTEKSIIKALDRIYQHQENFDLVIIIRGGGATSDLASFDSYELASNCAQFPLPIITGIGHERDDTILDFVAFYRAKTPTAVADYLITKTGEFYNFLIDCQSNIIDNVQQILLNNQEYIDRISYYLPIYTNGVIEKHKLSQLQIKTGLQKSTKQFLLNKKNALQTIESFIKLSSPDYILSKGYSITLKNGKALKTTKNLKTGDIVETVLSKGRIKSVISSLKDVR